MNFKHIDIYGRQINLTYEEEDKFKTRFGACVTLIVVLWIAFSFIWELILHYNGTNFKLDTIEINRPFHIKDSKSAKFISHDFLAIGIPRLSKNFT